MRSLVLVALLSGSARADDVNDKLVLEAATQAGFVKPEIVARGAVRVVVDPLPKIRIAVAVPGRTFVELAPSDAPTRAKIAPFLDRKDIIDIVLEIETAGRIVPLARHEHRLVRLTPLEEVCSYHGDFDSGDVFKAQREITTVKVSKIAAKPYTFRVTERNNHQLGGRDNYTTTTTTFTLPSSGACEKR